MRSRSRYQRLLAQHGCSKDVIEHSLAVARKTIALSNSFSIDIDQETCLAGAMLHDIGRSQTQGIRHFLVGAGIAREEGFPEEVVRIIERHVGAGITKKEAGELGLPPKDYLPITPEEITVSYADNITKGTRYVTFAQALQRFKSKLGENHPALLRIKKQHETIKCWKRSD